VKSKHNERTSQCFSTSSHQTFDSMSWERLFYLQSDTDP